jgi:anaerobic selenocysteine-containing dehydrogenase
VAFAWSKEGYGRHAQFTLPTAVYPEVTDDIPPAVDSPAASFRLATPLVAPPAGVVKPAEFVAGAAGLTVNDPLRERADAIHAAGRGNLFTYADGKSMAVKDVKADDFWKALNAGGCWIDAVNEKAMAPKLASKAAPAKKPVFEHDLPLVAVLYEGLGSAAPGSPLLSKLYQESNLRLGPDGVALHPDAARACGVKHGDRATLQTALGKCTVEVAIDVNVPPGLIRVAARPVVLDMCAAGTRAKVVRA